MKPRLISAVLLSALCAPMTALADRVGRVIDAPVVSVEPIIAVVRDRVPQEVCREERVRVVDRGGWRGGDYRSATPTILGAVLGGTVAGALGDDTGHQGVIAGAGALLGGSIGRDIGRNRTPRYRDSGYYVTEDVCTVEYETLERERVDGYRVRYRYEGNIYETRSDRDPGETIPVRVQLQPLL